MKPRRKTTARAPEVSIPSGSAYGMLDWCATPREASPILPLVRAAYVDQHPTILGCALGGDSGQLCRSIFCLGGGGVGPRPSGSAALPHSPMSKHGGGGGYCGATGANFLCLASGCGFVDG